MHLTIICQFTHCTKAWTHVHVHTITSNLSLQKWQSHFFKASDKQQWVTHSGSCIKHTNLPHIQLPCCPCLLSHQAGVWCLQKGMTHTGQPCSAGSAWAGRGRGQPGHHTGWVPLSWRGLPEERRVKSEFCDLAGWLSCRCRGVRLAKVTKYNDRLITQEEEQSRCPLWWWWWWCVVVCVYVLHDFTLSSLFLCGMTENCLVITCLLKYCPKVGVKHLHHHCWAKHS